MASAFARLQYDRKQLADISNLEWLKRSLLITDADVKQFGSKVIEEKMAKVFPVFREGFEGWWVNKK